jgi:hypothetical protein
MAPCSKLATAPAKISISEIKSCNTNRDNTMTESADLLYGVPAIASFLGLPVKNTYYLIEKRRLPHFRIGKTVCARRSTILSAMDASRAGGQLIEAEPAA